MDSMRLSEKEIDQHVGMQIRKWRTVRQMTQSNLAEACHISFQQIQKYENAMNRVSVSRLLQICKALRMPVEEIFKGLPGYPVDDGVGRINESELAALRLVAKLSSSQRSAFAQLLTNASG